MVAKKDESGFSLVEISIVIVVISLILTAILKGQSLINESKMQAIISEVSKHKISITSFYNKYREYPGDFDEAVANWGGTTKDGDNDGAIEFVNTLGTPTYEGYLAWQHLAYARMTDVPYLGTQTTSAAALESDIPRSTIGGGYFFDYSSSATDYDHVTAGAYGMLGKTVLILGVPAATAASPVKANGTMTPEQAMDIDSKMDDGVPTTGSVRGADGNASSAGSCQASSLYKLTVSGEDCILIFKAYD